MRGSGSRESAPSGFRALGRGAATGGCQGGGRGWREGVRVVGLVFFRAHLPPNPRGMRVSGHLPGDSHLLSPLLFGSFGAGDRVWCPELWSPSSSGAGP